MFYDTSYSQPLRTIGQALEILRVGAFDVVREGNDFLVRGNVPVLTEESVRRHLQESNVQYIWGDVGDRSGDQVSADSTQASGAVLELRYNPKDLDRLEHEGRINRSDPRGMADASSLPQLLRTVGAYVNEKGARLVKLSREDQTMTVQYQTGAGQGREETFTVSSLYDVWVRMYMRRATRNGSS